MMLGLQPELLRLWHWQSDGVTLFFSRETEFIVVQKSAKKRALLEKPSEECEDLLCNLSALFLRLFLPALGQEPPRTITVHSAKPQYRKFKTDIPGKGIAWSQ
jgi:hypothetical protein